MDPRDRADETLARARARGAFVITPENATSPMDAASTVQIPRSVVSANDPVNPAPDHDPTVVLRGRVSRGPYPGQQAGPQGHGPQGPGQQVPNQQGHGQQPLGQQQHHPGTRPGQRPPSGPQQGQGPSLPGQQSPNQAAGHPQNDSTIPPWHSEGY